MYEYLNPKLIREITKGNKDCLDHNSYYIGSVGDLMLETEYHKETITSNEFEAIFNNVCLDHQEFFIQEVSRLELICNMFEISDDGLFLDPEVNRYDTPPHYTLNYVALKPNVNINFWDEDILVQMKTWFND
jgi:hypothetical protein